MGEAWTLEAVQHLRRLVAEGAPVTVIAMAMRRGAGDVHDKLSDLGLSPPMDGHEEEEGAGERAAPQPEPGSASF